MVGSVSLESNYSDGQDRQSGNEPMDEPKRKSLIFVNPEDYNPDYLNGGSNRTLPQFSASHKKVKIKNTFDDKKQSLPVVAKPVDFDSEVPYMDSNGQQDKEFRAPQLSS